MKTPKKAWKDIAKKLKNRKSTSFAKGTAIEKSRAIPTDVEEVKGSLDVEEHKKAATDTGTDTQLCGDINKSSENINIDQPTRESCEKAETEPNIPESLPSELYSESCRENSEGEKPSKKSSQSIVAGIVGAGLLASCVALYIMKMPIVAVALGIVGLTCAGFALYNLLKPKTKFEEMKDVEQHTTQPLCSLLCY